MNVNGGWLLWRYWLFPSSEEHTRHACYAVITSDATPTVEEQVSVNWKICMKLATRDGKFQSNEKYAIRVRSKDADSNVTYANSECTQLDLRIESIEHDWNKKRNIATGRQKWIRLWWGESAGTRRVSPMPTVGFAISWRNQYIFAVDRWRDARAYAQIAKLTKTRSGFQARRQTSIGETGLVSLPHRTRPQITTSAKCNERTHEYSHLQFVSGTSLQ